MKDRIRGLSVIKKWVKPFLLLAMVLLPSLGLIYGIPLFLGSGFRPMGLFGPAAELRSLDARSDPERFLNNPVMAWVDSGRQMAFTFNDELYLVDAEATETRRLSRPRTDDYFAYASAPSAAPAATGWPTPGTARGTTSTTGR